jgi:predicted AlkP superfamily pyrophosphatase or phosphodiesterase
VTHIFGDMNRWLVAALRAGVLACAVAIGTATADAQGRSGRPVIFISIDGLRPDYVLEADRHGLRIPNLRRFLKEGSHATTVRGVLPTVTYPSHTTLLTGASPATHGVVANTTFDPLERNDNGWYWYAEDIKVATLWDVAARAGMKTANVHWPVSVGANIALNLPQIWDMGTPDDRKLMRALATKGLLDRLEKELGPYADGIDESIEGDENRARFTVKLLESERPQFMTAYFTALDHEQHLHGPYTPKVWETLERIDAIVGRVVIAARAAHGNAVTVAIASDHGHILAGKDLALPVALRERGWLSYASDTARRPSAWRVALWGSTGAGALMVHDSAPGGIVGEVGTLLRRLAADTMNGIANVWTPEEAKSLGAYPGASFVIGMRPGHRVVGTSRGALRRDGTPGGTHGYPPDTPGIDAAFLLMGPGVRAGHSFGRIDMRDVAPTLAAILGVPLPAAEGRNLVARPAVPSNGVRPR